MNLAPHYRKKLAGVVKDEFKTSPSSHPLVAPSHEDDIACVEGETASNSERPGRAPKPMRSATYELSQKPSPRLVRGPLFTWATPLNSSGPTAEAGRNHELMLLARISDLAPIRRFSHGQRSWDMPWEARYIWIASDKQLQPHVVFQLWQGGSRKKQSAAICLL